MTTPVYDFVNDYLAEAPLRLHMPGHKGSGPLGCEARDLTEIPGADVLYHASGILRESQQNAAALFGSARTLYSAEGSSLSIRAMLYLALQYAGRTGRPPRILAGRNAHQVFLTGAALLGLEIEWLFPREGSLLSCRVTAGDLEAALSQGDPPAAVYLTSPDYLGNILDLAPLSAVCHRHGCLLLVDNAHGAYLKFLPTDRHPLTQGADLCCDSAHKTLPVLTGGGYLHFAHGLPAQILEAGPAAMRLFASTSPSYLILQSLDLANRTLAGSWREALERTCEAAAALKARLAREGWQLAGEEPLKLTLLPNARGWTGTALERALRVLGVTAEYADLEHLVLMLPPQAEAEDLARLEAALRQIPRQAPILPHPPPLPRPEQVLPPRAALLSPAETLPLSQCAGRILAAPTVSCPPAVPPAVCGERLTPEVLAVLAHYGLTSCRVVSPDVFSK